MFFDRSLCSFICVHCVHLFLIMPHYRKSYKTKKICLLYLLSLQFSSYFLFFKYFTRKSNISLLTEIQYSLSKELKQYSWRTMTTATTSQYTCDMNDYTATRIVGFCSHILTSSNGNPTALIVSLEEDVELDVKFD